MTYKTECYRCDGKGVINWARHVKGGTCFACNGSGIKIYARKPIKKTKYAFGTNECFPQFWNYFTTDQKAANFAGREGKTIFMDEDEYNSRFDSIEEASAWASGETA